LLICGTFPLTAEAEPSLDRSRPRRFYENNQPIYAQMLFILVGFWYF
jgi:hypothetical protein